MVQMLLDLNADPHAVHDSQAARELYEEKLARLARLSSTLPAASIC